MPRFDVLNFVAAGLREELGVPEGWVGVFADEHDGECIKIGLEWVLEDVGGPESGLCLSAYPTRWLTLIEQPENRWRVELEHLEDHEALEDEDEKVPPRALHFVVAPTPALPAVIARFIADKPSHRIVRAGR